MLEPLLIRVCFVCLGNICRSPTAEGVMLALVAEAGLEDRIEVDSAGTDAYHVGEEADPRSQRTAERRGVALPSIARRFEPEDFDRFDYILAMDRSNLSHLGAMEPHGYAGHLGLFLDFHPNAPIREVPDPYYGGDAGFEEVLDLVESAGRGLLAELSGKS